MSAEAINPSSEKATVVAALQRASAVTGSDFHYLLGTAMRESSLKPEAQSPTSSAASSDRRLNGNSWAAHRISSL